MKINFSPKTYSGKLAVWIGIALVILTLLSLIFAIAIGGDPAVIANSTLLTILANALSIMFTLAGPLSFFVGIYTGVKHKEWSIFKPLLVLYLITFILFLLGEFLFSH
jgi:hypothetical protein